MIAAPSPTLSTRSSVHFATSVALRDNKPGDGSTSLNLLNTNNAGSHNKRGRKASWASSGEGHSSLKGTESDHGGIELNTLHRATSAATSMTSCQSGLGRGVDRVHVPAGRKGVEILMMLRQFLKQLGERLVN